MRNLRFKILLTAIILCVAMLPVAPSANAAKENHKFWKSELKKYKNDDSVGQIVLVKHTTGSNAIVEFYVKVNGNWKMLRKDMAYIGKYGLGKVREGDKHSPIGDFGIRQAFGILDNPGTAIPYLKVKPSHYACDDDCKYYNQIIDTIGTGHKCTGEHMIRIAPDYNYGLEMDYNNDNVYPLGSAIFFHCKGRKPHTSGCVAVDEDFMKLILQKSTKSLRVIINEK